jgi:hypothetical protein
MASSAYVAVGVGKMIVLCKFCKYTKSVLQTEEICLKGSKIIFLFLISGFRRDADELSTLLGY